MKRITTEVSGWADSIDGNKVKFAIALAINNAGFGSMWDIEVIIAKGSDVRKEFSLFVTAKTATMSSYEDEVYSRTYNVLKTYVDVPSYTMKNVYESALEAFRKLKKEQG